MRSFQEPLSVSLGGLPRLAVKAELGRQRAEGRRKMNNNNVVFFETSAANSSPSPFGGPTVRQDVTSCDGFHTHSEDCRVAPV